MRGSRTNRAGRAAAVLAACLLGLLPPIGAQAQAAEPTAAEESAAETAESAVSETSAAIESTAAESLPEGQRKATITVVSIVGNELTYTEDSGETSTGGTSQNTEEDSRPERGEAPDFAGGMPEQAGEKPESIDEMPGFTGGTPRETGGEDDEYETAEGGRKGQRESAGGDERTPERVNNGNSGGDSVLEEQYDVKSGDDKAAFDEESADRDSASDAAGEESVDTDHHSYLPDDGSGEEDSGQTADEKQEKRSRDGARSGRQGGRNRQNTTTVYLPVGIVVHTDLDEHMTFAILEAGDTLTALFEETENGEVITELWMQTGTES